MKPLLIINCGPYFIGQVNAWTALPSSYAVEAMDENDIVNAVNFAKENNLRLVVKGTGKIMKE